MLSISLALSITKNKVKDLIEDFSKENYKNITFNKAKIIVYWALIFS